MSRPEGVTLFETLIAILIAGLFSLAALPPVLKARRVLEFSAITDRVRSQLHEVRVLSIVRGQDCRFRVSSPTSYLVECETPAWQTVRAHDLPAGYTITANNRPEFHPLGNVGPMGTIRIRNPDGNQKRVIVSRSGRVRTQ